MNSWKILGVSLLAVVATGCATTSQKELTPNLIKPTPEIVVKADELSYTVTENDFRHLSYALEVVRDNQSEVWFVSIQGHKVPIEAAPTKTYKLDEATCRDFIIHSPVVESTKFSRLHHTACKNADGTWTILGTE